MMGKKTKRVELEEKVLDVDASIQGNVIFKDPVNLKINGKFEGTLTTKGNLTIGEGAEVTGDIVGENIVIAGRVTGDIIAQRSLRLVSPAKLIGDIKTAALEIEDGALLNGNCQMIFDDAEIAALAVDDLRNAMTADDVARHLGIDTKTVADWAEAGKLAGRRDGVSWRFDRSAIDDLVKNGKLK